MYFSVMTFDMSFSWPLLATWPSLAMQGRMGMECDISYSTTGVAQVVEDKGEKMQYLELHSYIEWASGRMNGRVIYSEKPPERREFQEAAWAQ